MASNVNRVPFNEIPEKVAFDPDLGPLFRKILDILNQSRNKLGGDSDFIIELQADTQSINTRDLNGKIRALQADNQALRAALSNNTRNLRNIEKRLTAFIAETATNG